MFAHYKNLHPVSKEFKPAASANTGITIRQSTQKAALVHRIQAFSYPLVTSRNPAIRETCPRHSASVRPPHPFDSHKRIEQGQADASPSPAVFLQGVGRFTPKFLYQAIPGKTAIQDTRNTLNIGIHRKMVEENFAAVSFPL